MAIDYSARARLATQALELRKALIELLDAGLPDPHLDAEAFKAAVQNQSQSFRDFGPIFVELNRKVFDLARIEREK